MPNELTRRNGAGVLALPGFRATPVGLIANKGLTRDQWEEAGHKLEAVDARLSCEIEGRGARRKH